MNKQYKFSSTIPMVFGQMVVIYRKKMNLTQKDLAKVLGVGGANISKIESGDTVISLEQLFIICLLFNEKPSDFFIKFEKSLKILDENRILVGNTKVKEFLINKEAKVAHVSGGALAFISGAVPVLGTTLGSVSLLLGAISALGINKNSKFDPFVAEKNDENIILPIIQGDQLYTYIIQSFS
ncbi:helix-turn-helix transcriptional regulator [Acinetobacter defluvii]|uniref:helix-turn-helix transcriptional regulator n=1 Tax=Acinetobacter defluvii TaxID=1871111 RepID=UPI003AF6AF59